MGLADVVSSPTPRTEEAGFDLDSALDEILAGLGSGGPAIDETALGRAEEDTLSLEQELAALALAPRDALVGERMAAAAMALEDYPAAIRHYLEFLSTIEDPRNGRDKLDKLSQPVTQEGRSYPGFNLFDADDDALFQTILRGEFHLSGLQNKSLRRFLPHLNSGQVSRLLKRLRLHGLIKKLAHGYKYYVTTFGKDILAAGLKLRELVIIPQLAYGRVP